jgi:hypothetical protein
MPGWLHAIAYILSLDFITVPGGDITLGAILFPIIYWSSRLVSSLRALDRRVKE